MSPSLYEKLHETCDYMVVLLRHARSSGLEQELRS